MTQLHIMWKETLSNNVFWFIQLILIIIFIYMGNKVIITINDSFVAVTFLLLLSYMIQRLGTPTISTISYLESD